MSPPWQSSGLGSMFPPQWVRVPYLVEELRSLVPHGMTRSLRGASCEGVGQENSAKCPHSLSLQIAEKGGFQNMTVLEAGVLCSLPVVSSPFRARGPSNTQPDSWELFSRAGLALTPLCGPGSCHGPPKSLDTPQLHPLNFSLLKIKTQELLKFQPASASL